VSGWLPSTYGEAPIGPVSVSIAASSLKSMSSGTSNGIFRDETFLAVRRVTVPVNDNASLALNQHALGFRMPHGEEAAADGPRSHHHGPPVQSGYRVGLDKPRLSLQSTLIGSEG
jgi:hypothetical protein